MTVLDYLQTHFETTLNALKHDIKLYFSLPSWLILPFNPPLRQPFRRPPTSLKFQVRCSKIAFPLFTLRKWDFADMGALSLFRTTISLFLRLPSSSLILFPSMVRYRLLLSFWRYCAPIRETLCYSFCFR